MRIRSPSLPELHAFAAVVETGSFSQAAVRLAVTQGAISRSVLRLEARLGMELLERSPAGVRPTPAGRSYYDRVHPALAQLEAAVPTRQPAGTVLRVCAISSLNMRWLVPRLPSFRAECPHVDVVFRPYWKDDDFRRDDVDCWIQTRATATSRWPAHVQATYIVGREIVPICHPSVREHIRAPADLLRQPLLHHVNYPDNWALWCRVHGVDAGGLRLGAGFDLAAGLIEAVAAQMGVAVVQTCLIERELAEQRVAVPLQAPVSTGRGYYLCLPRARPETPVIEAFRRWLLSQAAVPAPAEPPRR
jgi:LysR family transcriptional regulator, glycine cleavage system transcriptional activator